MDFISEGQNQIFYGFGDSSNPKSMLKLHIGDVDNKGIVSILPEYGGAIVEIILPAK